MPDISMPEVHLPDIKLPEGLRDINRRDIQNAINDRMPKKIEMPDVDLSKVELPKAVEDRLKQVEKKLDSIDLSKVELPKAVQDRLPGRRRSNPILPLAAILAVGSAFAKKQHRLGRQRGRTAWLPERRQVQVLDGRMIPRPVAVRNRP